MAVIVIVGAGTVAAIVAEHEASAPPLTPAHVQVQGPEPDGVEAVPVEQRLEVGTAVKAIPLAEPQAPLTKEAGFLVAVQVVVPPLDVAKQVQVDDAPGAGNAGIAGVGLPTAHQVPNSDPS